MSFQPIEDIIVDGTDDEDGLKRQYFNGKYETNGTIADAFRAFIEGQAKTNNIPQKHTDENNREIIKVQIVTKLIMVNDETKRLVAVIYYGKENPRNSVLRLCPPESCEQELAALIAIKRAVKETSTNTLLHIETVGIIPNWGIRGRTRHYINVLRKCVTLRFSLVSLIYLLSQSLLDVLFTY